MDSDSITRRAFVQEIAAAAGLTGALAAAAQAGDEKAEAGPIRTRFFWTWDHSTTWALNRPGGHDLGASNEYGRTPETFVADYSCLLSSRRLSIPSRR